MMFFRKFFVSQCRKKLYSNPSVFQRFEYRKIFCIGRIIIIFVESFGVTVPKKIVDESFGVSFNFGYRKNLCIRGVYHDILSKIFRLTVPKKCI